MHRVLLAVAIMGLPVALSAQRARIPAPHAAPVVTSSSDSSAATAMRDALVRLATSQERHYAERGTNTTDLATLGLLPAKGDSVFVQVAFAGGRGWTGAATHRAGSMRGKRCVMYVGDKSELPVVLSTASKAEPEDEGMPLCDR
jgi:hypothetical protein